MANITKPLMNTPRAFAPDTTLHIDGMSVAAEVGEPLIEAINRASAMREATPIPQVCYLKPMGSIGSCDTCMVELNGELVRACETPVPASATVLTTSERADVAQRVAFDRLLYNHDLYCTVCDNNNQNCTVHNTVSQMHVKHQTVPFTPKPYEQDHSNPFTVTIRASALRAAVVWKPARTCRSMRRSQLTGVANARV